MSPHVYDRVKRILDKYFYFLDRATDYMLYFCVFVFLIAFVLINLRFITRAVGVSVAWINELTIWSVILITFFLTGFLIWKDEHLQVEIISQRLPFKYRYILRICQLIFISILSVMIVIWGYEYAQVGGRRSALTLPIAMFWPYMIMPIGGVLMTILSISKIIQLVIYPNTIVKDYNDRYGDVIEEEQEKSQVEDVTELEDIHG